MENIINVIFNNQKAFSPYIIAEIGVNHGGDIELAKKLIDLVAEAGGHAAKFQTYKSEKLASKHSPAYWDTTKEKCQSQYELFKKYDSFTYKEYEILSNHCENSGITFVSTPFDDEAVDFLNELMPFFKLASADITNVPLIRKIASKKKPVIMSTGASYLNEIKSAVSLLENSGVENIGILHCVLNYPTDHIHAQIGRITTLKKEFERYVIGYSDHVPPGIDMPALELATLLGAQIIEKHFTHDKTLPGNDHYHAMDADDLKSFIAKLDTYRKLYGDQNWDLTNQSASRLHARRSIVAKVNIKKGKVISEQDIIPKRPGTGISCTEWDKVVGKVAKKSIKEDTLLTWEDLE